MDLSTKYMGLALSSPLIVGSCGLTKSVKAVEQCACAGAGAVVLKSIFEEQIVAEVDALVASGEQTLWHPEADEYIRSYGREGAVTAFLDLVRDSKKAVGIPIIASVHCVSPGIWTEFASRLQKAGADAIELNINVLTSDTRLSGAEMERAYFSVVEAVRKASGIPVSVKLGYHFSGMAGFLSRLSESGLAGLTLFNRSYNSDFDVERFELTAARFLSSPNEYVLPLRWISLLAGRAGCDLCASTGVHDGKTAVKMLLAGAAAVQTVSVLYDRGVEHLQTMVAEVRAYMERHGFERIADFRGRMSQALSDNPAAYERVQFMRHSVGIE
ncbi:MAG: dihydroorotate dehydrogenase-like protein [Myxococcota bacterium]|jgi:dihydroorotate dehydrogenase (fumarate)|nr:dihydroorotate dehydrogenase-like protein [Myxococcota bacterium]